jgi:hypothetical protein
MIEAALAESHGESSSIWCGSKTRDIMADAGINRFGGWASIRYGQKRPTPNTITRRHLLLIIRHFAERAARRPSQHHSFQLFPSG